MLLMNSFTPVCKKTVLRYLSETIETIEKIPAQTPCLLCSHYEISTSQCAKWASAVPEAFLEKGCSEFIENDIPF